MIGNYSHYTWAYIISVTFCRADNLPLSQTTSLSPSACPRQQNHGEVVSNDNSQHFLIHNWHSLLARERQRSCGHCQGLQSQTYNWAYTNSKMPWPQPNSKMTKYKVITPQRPASSWKTFLLAIKVPHFCVARLGILYLIVPASWKR